MRKNRIIGAKYLPTFYGEWQKGVPYLPLTMVTFKGDSYISKKEVPVSVDISNNGYWERTGQYNAQLENYIRQVRQYANDLNTTSKQVNDICINVQHPPKVKYNGKYLQPILPNGLDQFENLYNLCQYIRTEKNWEGGLKLKFPSGTYSFSKFPMYTYISVEGDGKRNTIFKPLIGNYDKFFYLDSAPVQFIKYKGFSVHGLSNYKQFPIVNPQQNCLNIEAIYKVPVGQQGTGGLWFSVFEDIEIKGFAKNSIEFICNPDSRGDMANQFITFKNCDIMRINTEDSRCLKGSANQIQWDNCRLENEITGKSVVGTNITCGGHMLFNLLTSENTDKTMEITSGRVELNSPWFENAKHCITITGQTKVLINNPNFANACYDGNDGGYGVKTNSAKCYCLLNMPNFIGSIDNTIIEGNEQSSIEIVGLKSLSKVSTQKVKQIATSENKEWFEGNIALINSGGIIQNVKEDIIPGNDVTLIAFQGNVTIKKGGNIMLQNDIQLSTSGDTVTLTRIDKTGAKYIVKNIFKQN